MVWFSGEKVQSCGGWATATALRHRESTLTENWQEAQKRLRERLLARDDNVLEVVRKGEGLTLGQWVEHFLTIYSTPPVRAEKTHAVNVRVAKILNVTLGSRKTRRDNSGRDRGFPSRPPSSTEAFQNF
jgi:hypothetical protein